MVNKTYYEILGVAPDATQAAIKKQYRRLALATHPDKNPDDVKAATARFQLLQQAAETLCDPASRSRYDAELRNTARPGKASEKKGSSSSSSSSSSHSASSSSPSGKSKASSSSKFKPSPSSSSPPPPASSCSSFKTQFPPFRYKNVGGEDVSDKEKKARKRRRYRERQKERRQHRGRKF